MTRKTIQRLDHHTLEKYENIWLGISIVMSLLLAVAVFSSFFSGTLPRIEGEGGAGHHLEGVVNGRINPKNLAGTPFANPGVRKNADGTLYRNPNGSLDVFVLASAKQGFTFLPRVLNLPVNTPINFNITSEDILHGYYVEKTNINVTVIPGQVSSFTTTLKHLGKLNVVCDEYCGIGHHNMLNTINVQTEEEFEKGLTP